MFMFLLDAMLLGGQNQFLVASLQVYCKPKLQFYIYNLVFFCYVANEHSSTIWYIFRHSEFSNRNNHHNNTELYYQIGKNYPIITNKVEPQSHLTSIAQWQFNTTTCLLLV